MYVSDEKGSTCAAEREAYLLRNFDFECPGTRFLAVSLWDNGIGANMNYIAVPALMAGLVTNRVVLFVNKVPGKRKIMSTRWSLASCPRRDFQCFFKAASPYVPTVKELNEAYGLTRTEKQDLFHRGEVPIGHENDKVIYMMGLQKTPSMHLGGRLESTLYNISMSLIDSAATKVADPALLRSAADSITSQDGNRPGYHFQFSTSKIHHGLLFYALRPSLLSKHRINSILNQVVPANFDPAKSIGLPIRASDKCVRESECLSFLQHMQVAGKAWKRHQEAFPMDDRFRPIILFTTESSVMLNEQHTFVNRSGSRHLDFVSNKFDVTPNAGRIYESSKFTADQAMLSSVVTLKLQLMARITLGNCCSNYHNLIHAFLVEGCGSARQNSFECLQENDDPEFRVCCWNSRSCIEERHRQMDQSANSSRPDFLRSLYEPT